MINRIVVVGSGVMGRGIAYVGALVDIQLQLSILMKLHFKMQRMKLKLFLKKDSHVWKDFSGSS